MFRRLLWVLSLTISSLLVLHISSLNAQTTNGGDAAETQSEDPTPTLNASGELDLEALAAEFNLPSHILNPRVDSERLELLLLPLTEKQLSAAAEAWQRIVQEQTQDVVNATLRVGEMSGETADLFRERLSAPVVAGCHRGGNHAIHHLL